MAENLIKLVHPEDIKSYGISDAEFLLMCTQVSAMISRHNEQFPGEMLDKAPQFISDTFHRGESVVVATHDGTVISHGAVYPGFEDGEEEQLGWEFYEFGSAIVNEAYRGQGLGKLTAKLRREKLDDIAHRPYLVVSTNKDGETTRTLRHARMGARDFWPNPYSAYLTCTCEKSSERCGHESCIFRRPPEESTPDKLKQIYDRKIRIRHMSCTLVTSKKFDLRSFETNCRKKHKAMGLLPLKPGEISIDTMQRAAEFFNNLKNK